MLANPVQNNETSEVTASDAIAASAVFRDLPEQVVSALADASSIRDYSAGETIFAMGQFDGSEFLIVHSGKVKASHADSKTSAMMFEEISAGETFGLPMAAIGGETRLAAGISLTAERDSKVVAIDAETLREMTTQRPSLTRNLMVYFARRLLGDDRSAEENSPERRVYAALCSYIERDAVNAEWRIARMPKHRELADRADVDEADAASAVAKLIQSGIARRNYPGLIIDDIGQLNRLAR
jgi:CRP-like cAMP-binding protein